MTDTLPIMFQMDFLNENLWILTDFHRIMSRECALQKVRIDSGDASLPN